MMKLIFLDIDGVLVPRSRNIPTDGEEVLGDFNPECIESLVAIVAATKARIVLSSSWRRLPHGRAAVNDLLCSRGLEPLLGLTPWMLCVDGTRGDEILSCFTANSQLLKSSNIKDDEDLLPADQDGPWLYMKEDPITAFVVLDDYNVVAGVLDDEKKRVLGPRFVRTDQWRGLRPHDASYAVEVLTDSKLQIDAKLRVVDAES